MKHFWCWSTHQIIHFVKNGKYLCNGAIPINKKGKIGPDEEYNMPSTHICKNCERRFNPDGTLK